MDVCNYEKHKLKSILQYFIKDFKSLIKLHVPSFKSLIVKLKCSKCSTFERLPKNKPLKLEFDNNELIEVS
jgi:hypothetical protein